MMLPLVCRKIGSDWGGWVECVNVCGIGGGTRETQRQLHLDNCLCDFCQLLALVLGTLMEINM